MRAWVEHALSRPEFLHAGSPAMLRSGLAACGYGSLTALVDAAEARLHPGGPATPHLAPYG